MSRHKIVSYIFIVGRATIGSPERPSTSVNDKIAGFYSLTQEQ